MATKFSVNDEAVSLELDPQTPLLEVLRNELGKNGPKFGCGLAQCGACAVLLDDVSIRSCVTLCRRISRNLSVWGRRLRGPRRRR